MKRTERSQRSKETSSCEAASQECAEPAEAHVADTGISGLIRRTTVIYVEEVRRALESGEYNLESATETEEKNREIRQRVLWKLTSTQ